eukprot:TRINITY_DN65621_c1_g1_i1.p1 TRINITY_DN65621_c1_g1~~TRINITY_DN65621_c1_g1_i1.p1  ORF type:complete len:562 (+),score=330.51 TRINITY_DN65621_c1_g1_i1:162-1688(+)
MDADFLSDDDEEQNDDDAVFERQQRMEQRVKNDADTGEDVLAAVQDNQYLGGDDNDDGDQQQDSDNDDDNEEEDRAGKQVNRVELLQEQQSSMGVLESMFPELRFQGLTAQIEEERQEALAEQRKAADEPDDKEVEPLLDGSQLDAAQAQALMEQEDPEEIFRRQSKSHAIKSGAVVVDRRLLERITSRERVELFDDESPVRTHLAVTRQDPEARRARYWRPMIRFDPRVHGKAPIDEQYEQLQAAKQQTQQGQQQKQSRSKPNLPAPVVSKERHFEVNARLRHVLFPELESAKKEAEQQGVEMDSDDEEQAPHIPLGTVQQFKFFGDDGEQQQQQQQQQPQEEEREPSAKAASTGGGFSFGFSVGDADDNDKEQQEEEEEEEKHADTGSTFSLSASGMFEGDAERVEDTATEASTPVATPSKKRKSPDDTPLGFSNPQIAAARIQRAQQAKSRPKSCAFMRSSSEEEMQKNWLEKRRQVTRDFKRKNRTAQKRQSTMMTGGRRRRRR